MVTSNCETTISQSFQSRFDIEEETNASKTASNKVEGHIWNTHEEYFKIDLQNVLKYHDNNNNNVIKCEVIKTIRNLH